MKKSISTIAIAIIGGFISIGVYKAFEKDSVSISKYEPAKPKMVHQVNYQGSMPHASADFTQAAEMTVNSVVHVKTTSTNDSYSQQFNDPFYQFFYGQGFSQPRQPRKVRAAGSGVIVSADGYIVTNNHVVEGADKVDVVLNDNKSYLAEVIGTDPATDLALLKIEAEDLSYIEYTNSDQTKIGEWVLAVGNPFNLTSTVTAGIISAKARSLNVLGRDPETNLPSIESFIQTDAAVNPGNSGGALVNTRGELVGINSAIKSQTGSYVGYSFAIPSNMVSKVVRDLKEFGTVQRAFIGINIRNIDNALAEEKELTDLKGVFVSGIAENGAASGAGIKIGDVITKVGTVEVNNVPELQEQVSQFRPGEEILVTLIRDNEEIEKKVLLKNFEGNTKLVKKERKSSVELLGAAFEPIGNQEMKKLKLHGGLKVTKLWSGKMMKAGIRKGFIITKIDNESVSNVKDLTLALENKKGGVLLEGIYPNGKAMYYGLGL